MTLIPSKKITSREGISPEVFNKDIGIVNYYRNKFIFLPTLLPPSQAQDKVNFACNQEYKFN
ncbi:hypothetical protein [Nostoc sp.]|uniref:hypothetical protein n=1 Tax=Nostoc sp. TaxID=1180 RepID=UPI002FF6DBBB